MQKALKTSPTYYKDRVDPKNYSFEETEKYVHRDRYLVKKSNNALVPLEVYRPYLVLRDSAGTARFTLYHKVSDKCIVIKSIQRERTKPAYVGVDERKQESEDYSPEIETRESKKFAEQLEMHPSEFILSEFLHRMRNKIRQGYTVYMDFGDSLEVKKTYAPLIDRFFHKKPVRNPYEPFVGYFWVYELNPNKRRVTQILGLLEK